MWISSCRVGGGPESPGHFKAWGTSVPTSDIEMSPSGSAPMGERSDGLASTLPCAESSEGVVTLVTMPSAAWYRSQSNMSEKSSECPEELDVSPSGAGDWRALPPEAR